MIPVTPTIVLDESEIEERFIRASGPGGQNVNKVASAVQLRFDAANSPSLSAPVKRRLRAVAGSRMTADGIIVIQAERFRSQARNREDALDRLCAMIRDAAQTPKPRVATRPSLAAKRRRADAKVHRGRIKQGRRKPGIEE